MDKFISGVKAFMQDEEGLSVVEYVIGAALLVGAITTVFSSMNTKLASKFNGALDSISG